MKNGPGFPGPFHFALRREVGCDQAPLLVQPVAPFTFMLARRKL